MSFSKPSATGRPFIKMHGLRNHFVIVDARHDPYHPPAAEIEHICDPQSGVGADQLVVLEPAQSAGADVFMRLYNVDGREVGACGNATRCVAWLLLEERGVDRVTVETLAGLLACHRMGDRLVSCDMGRIRTDWRAIPLAEAPDPKGIELAGLDGGIALNVGNPHLVFFVSDVEALDLPAIATQIQAQDLFPESVNVGIAQPLPGGGLRLRVYERGAGLTMACGSGACAAAYAARLRGLTDAHRVAVSLPGGDLWVELAQRDGAQVHAVMTGPVALSFRGELLAP